MATRQERLAARRARIAKQATAIIEGAVTRVVAARPAVAIDPGKTVGVALNGQSDPQEVKALRDGGMAWWVIGQKLGLSGAASSASEPEAKRGAGRARALYAAANRGEVPRTHKPRAGATVKPTGPGRGGSVVSRKEQLVNEGHVIPRDMPDEEVEALVLGRTIEWAIDLARLTETDPDTWGDADRRWVSNDAKVHVDPQWVYVSTEDSGERTLRFREYAGYDTDRQKHMSGPTRVVRVDSIYTIR
jgi:hypothetical protein